MVRKFVSQNSNSMSYSDDDSRLDTCEHAARTFARIFIVIWLVIHVYFAYVIYDLGKKVNLKHCKSKLPEY